MKVILIITFMLMGAGQPTQHAGEVKDLETCEAEAHRFMTYQFSPDEVHGTIVFRSAACALVLPGKAT